MERSIVVWHRLYGGNLGTRQEIVKGKVDSRHPRPHQSQLKTQIAPFQTKLFFLNALTSTFFITQYFSKEK